MNTAHTLLRSWRFHAPGGQPGCQVQMDVATLPPRLLSSASSQPTWLYLAQHLQRPNTTTMLPSSTANRSRRYHSPGAAFVSKRPYFSHTCVPVRAPLRSTRHTLLIVLHAIATWQLSFHTFHTELGLLTRSPRSLHHDSELPKRSNTRQSVFSGLVTATVLLNVPARFARRPEHGSGTRTKSGSLQCAHVLSVHHPRARRNVQHGAWTGTLSAACCTHGTSASGRFGLNVK